MKDKSEGCFGEGALAFGQLGASVPRLCIRAKKSFFTLLLFTYANPQGNLSFFGPYHTNKVSINVGITFTQQKLKAFCRV